MRKIICNLEQIITNFENRYLSSQSKFVQI